MSHCLEGVTCPDGLPAVDEEISQFFFLRGGHYWFDDLVDGDEGSIVCWNGKLFDMKKWPPARLLAFDSES